MKFLTVAKLGPKRERTPEGFLLCRDVPIGRTGIQIYGPGETPIAPGPDGIVKIERLPEEVFRVETLASANGKPLVNEHPDDDVTPDNWRYLAMGHMQDPHRGAGEQDDLALADLLITDRVAIQLVDDGKEELSLGYSADYEETAPGRGIQRNIVINHLALVDSGRCGPRCSIGDHTPTCKCKENERMAKTTVTSRVGDYLRRAFKAKDEGELKKIEEEANDAMGEGGEGGGGVAVHLHEHGVGGDEKYCTDEAFKAHVEKNDDEHKAFDERLKALEGKGAGEGEGEGAEDKEIEGELEEEAPPGTGDKARKAKDSAFMVDSFAHVTATAEIIIPGISVPTFDRAADPKKTLDSMCQLRRKTLDLAYAASDTRDMIDDVLRGRPLETKTMKCRDIRSIFDAVGAMKRRANNDGGKGRSESFDSGTVPVGRLNTPAAINEANRKRFERRT